MTEFLGDSWFVLQGLLAGIFSADWAGIALKFFPFVLLFELPVQATVMLGALRHHLTRDPRAAQVPYAPTVSCIILCYSEGEAVVQTVRSLTEQLYKGHIELLAILDGSQQNVETYEVLKKLLPYVNSRSDRKLIVAPKTQRGGRVSSLNQGLAIATGEIVLALDGDTSFDNDMVQAVAVRFADPNVAAVSGNLRVRNAKKSLTTRLQALEYMLSIHLSRTGLAQFNIINNVSGAFGCFRREMLNKLGGWDSGTAEDLDLTLRIKKYFARHPNLRIEFAPDAVGHTDAPDTFWGFLMQRLRWDGDLYYLYVRKHWQGFRPDLMGWPNFIALVWSGLCLQLFLPFMVIIYMTYMLFAYPFSYVLGVMAFVYLFYLLLTLAMYLEYWWLLSERRRYDLSFAWVILLFPGFTFATRVWCAIATLTEIFMKQHLDSSMAPWWVLKKTKF